jgi:metal-sulfur cluster biosynthetic enzyme
MQDPHPDPSPAPDSRRLSHSGGGRGSDPDESVLRDALRQVVDPEAGMNIVDLGLIYGVETGAGAVRIDMTMTTAACPMADLIVDEVFGAIESVVPKGTEIDVQLVWDPPWTPERMSDLARERFGWTP